MYPQCLVSTGLPVYAKCMDKSLVSIQNSLVQSLLRTQTDGGGGQTRLLAAASQALHQSGVSAGGLSGASQNLNTTNLSTTQFNFPPALRQLLSQHGHVQQLLPQLRLLQQARFDAPLSATGATAGSAGSIARPVSEVRSVNEAGSKMATGSASSAASAQLLSQLLALLSQPLTSQAGRSGESLTPNQLRHFVSQWFSSQPTQALTTPVMSTQLTGAGGGALAALLPAFLPALLQWLLVQRSGHSGLAQLLRQSLSAAGASSAAPSGAAASTANALPPNLLSQFAHVVQGTLQDLRLSQIHLADTSASANPEYYLVVPYQSGDKTVALEWLLRKEARKPQQPDSAVWHFSLQLETGRYGPLLVKGSYQTSQHEVQGAGGLSTLRFYLSDTQRDKRGDFAATLDHLQQRLAKAGLTDVRHEVHVGIVPASLAPGESQLHPKRGHYGR